MFPENVATRLASDTAFGPAFFILNVKVVFAPVVEDAGDEAETETSAGILLRSFTTELRIT